MMGRWIAAALATLLLVAAVAGAGCGAPRQSRSAFETLLAALPLPAASLSYTTDPPRLSDGTWTATLGAVGPKDVPGGHPVGIYTADAATGRVATEGLLIEGPPGRGEEPLAWLRDQGQAAVSDPGLLAVARLVGEPSTAAVVRVRGACPATYAAAATRSGGGRERSLGAWILVYPDAASAAADLGRVRAAAVAGPPPGPVLQVDLRPPAVVVTYDGGAPTPPPTSLCR